MMKSSLTSLSLRQEEEECSTQLVLYILHDARAVRQLSVDGQRQILEGVSVSGECWRQLQVVCSTVPVCLQPSLFYRLYWRDLLHLRFVHGGGAVGARSCSPWKFSFSCYCRLHRLQRYYLLHRSA